jgi:hypothetical protein
MVGRDLPVRSVLPHILINIGHQGHVVAVRGRVWAG